MVFKTVASEKGHCGQKQDSIGEKEEKENKEIWDHKDDKHDSIGEKEEKKLEEISDHKDDKQDSIGEKEDHGVDPQGS